MRLCLQSNELKVIYKKVFSWILGQPALQLTERTLSRPILLEAKQKRCGLSSMALYPRQNSRFAFDFQVYHLTLFFSHHATFEF